MLKIGCQVIGFSSELAEKKLIAILRMVPKKPGYAELYEKYSVHGEPIFVLCEYVKYDFCDVQFPDMSENLQGYYNEYNVTRKDGQEEPNALYVVLRIDRNLPDKQRLIANRYGVSEVTKYLLSINSIQPESIGSAADLFNTMQLLHWIDITNTA